LKLVLRLAALLLLFTVLVGCRGGDFKPDSFSASDMCIVGVHSNEKICYGDTRVKAEKILGSGSKDLFGYTYDFGVTLMLRDDIVVGLSLDEGARDVYQTARGAKIGMSKSEIKKLYSNKYAIDVEEHNLDYFYDMKNKKFLGKGTVEGIKASDVSVNTFLLSSLFNDDGYASRIMLLDHKYAMTMS